MESILNEKIVLSYSINNLYSLIQIFQNVRSRSNEKYYMFFLLFVFLTERIFRKISAPSLKFNFVLPLLEVINKFQIHLHINTFEEKLSFLCENLDH